MEKIKEFIKIIKETLEADSQVKQCCEYNGGKYLQIQLKNGEVFMLGMTKLEKGTGKIIRRHKK